MSHLEKLKNLIFESDNGACFIERERILARLATEMDGYQGADRYALIFSKLLSEVSVPLLAYDSFAGRAVEALPDEGMTAPSCLLEATGHMSPDYAKILKMGLGGVLDEIKETARKKNTPAARAFAANAEIVVFAVKKYAERYAAEAEKLGKKEMAKALRTVPFAPAYDYYSALQSIWLLHMIASCYVGARDYAFGRFDAYMLPFYQEALLEGKSAEELTALLAAFLVKTNEICGRCTHNHAQKPILCNASKQYINIGGASANEFSHVVLDAAMAVNLPQPQIVVLLSPDADEAFVTHTFEALSVLTDKMNVYNYAPVLKALISKGVREDVAKDFTYSACCTFDLNYHTFRLERYVPVPQLFLQALHEGEHASLEDVLSSFRALVAQDAKGFAEKTQKGFSEEDARKNFVLDCLFLSDSASACHYPCDGTAPYNMINLFCPGIATLGDSLMVLDCLVFKEKRYSYTEFLRILDNDFAENEDLKKEISRFEKFGNDSEADTYAVLAANAFLDALDSVKLKNNFLLAPGFYSLERENSWCREVGATPDGRASGTPFSENQSPSYGADKSGITALLKSVAKLPFDRAPAGGLNLTFAQKVSADYLRALTQTYFAMGGLHVGIGVLDHDTLSDAMEHPEKYQSLTVRLYGFSEYFISLPKWQQIAVLNRTVYEKNS